MDELELRSELRLLELRLRSGEGSEARAFLDTLQRIPPGTLTRNGCRVTFTPHPLKKATKANRQDRLRYRARALLALST